MTRPKALIVVIVVALSLAGLASWLVLDFLKKKADESKLISGVNIVVAAADIPVGSTLSASQLKSLAWPKASLPQGHMTDLQAVVGRVNIGPLSAGEPVVEGKLMPKDKTPGSGIMSYIVPTGHRAITVAVNEVAGVAGFLAPNNKVDVVLTTTPPGSSEQLSKIILQNVPLLATGQITNQKDGKPVVVPTVTLDMTPEDSEKIVLAASKGALQLLLRGVLDTKEVVTKGATVTKVLNDARPVVAATPSRPRPRPRSTAAHAMVPQKTERSIEIIKGANRSAKQFAVEP